jgi:hypothetical protein
MEARKAGIRFSLDGSNPTLKAATKRRTNCSPS